MLKMILADDEPVITKGIRKLVDWTGLGIEIIGAYEDGKAALDGIVTHKPDIALLDIYMPKKTGIDILKELKLLEIGTKVIFISGFQDFQYAKDALTFGAVDYLLKPVIKDELVKTIEKCILSLRPELSEERETDRAEPSSGEYPEAAYEKLVEVEACRYLPVVTRVLYKDGTGPQEKKLIQFSILSFLENYLEESPLGIVFIKNGDIVMVLKNVAEESIGMYLDEIMEKAGNTMQCHMGFIVGTPVDSMGEIPEGYQRCLSMDGYFYFSDQLMTKILRYGETVYRTPIVLDDVREIRNQMIDAMVAQDEENFEDFMARFKRAVCIVADGRKDDACFHYGSTIRIIEERFETMGITGLSVEFKDILELARGTESFKQLTELFESYFRHYKENIRRSVVNNDKKEIIRAREYIEQHYKENLTLEVLAGEIHMNSYYFSSFFKKNSGENFKDYLNKVRMKHALSLLVSTDKRAAEIADEVGFRDGRSFSELFQRFYGETPSNYRKRVREN